ERFIVRTRDAEVEVRGTRFDVEAADGRIRRVEVQEGKVEVRFHDDRWLVAAGSSWTAPAERAVEATIAQPAMEPQPLPTAASERTPNTGVTASATAAPNAPPLDEASRAFAEGVTMIERGDYAAAAAKLDGFSAGHPGDARADDAAFLAIVALQRAGR